MYHQSIYWDYPITLNILKNNILCLWVFKYARNPRHCEHRKVRGNPFLFFKGEADSFVLRTQNDTSFSCHECRKVCAVSCRSVIASTFSCMAIRFSFLNPCTSLKYYNKVCTKLMK